MTTVRLSKDDEENKDGEAKAEQWADSFKAYVLDGKGYEYQGFSTNNAGRARYKAMEQRLEWLMGEPVRGW